MFVVFDLDDTLAHTEHRQHILGSGDYAIESDMWDAFFEECDKDTPNYEIMKALSVFAQAGHRVEIWTGRSDLVFRKTEKWLMDNLMECYRFITLRMRKQGDFRHDTEIKGEWIKEYGKPDLVFDDRNSVVRWWRKQGITCCQVKDAEF